MTVQKNSGFQWSGNFSQPPSTIENMDLNTQDLISEQNMETRKSSFNIIKTNVWQWEKVKLKYTLGLENSNNNNNKHWNRHLLSKGRHLSTPGKL